MTNALVLAGGGVAGIAWELGVLRGIADVDAGLADRIIAADVIVGTSAGSSVAAQITSGTSLTELYEAQVRPEHSELAVDVDLEELMQRFVEAVQAGELTDPATVRARLGTMALNAETVPESARRSVIAARLPSPDWPARRILLPAVDAVTGELMVFTRDSGVELIDAVAASCAVPGVWPPVSIGGRRFIDGGVRSNTNADLAAGADRVLVIMPTLPDAPLLPWGSLEEELALLKPAATAVISADQASVDAIGANPLSPDTRRPSAEAGRAIGRDRAGELATFWA
jgi:NTE family protein